MFYVIKDDLELTSDKILDISRQTKEGISYVTY